MAKVFRNLWKRLLRFVFFPGSNLFFFFNFLFIYFWLCWVFVSVRGLSLVVGSGGHSSSRCAGLSLSRPLLLWSTGSRRAGSVAVAHGPSCSAACGIFPDQGSNPCPLHQAGRFSTTAPPGKPPGSNLKEAVIQTLGKRTLLAVCIFFKVLFSLFFLLVSGQCGLCLHFKDIRFMTSREKKSKLLQERLWFHKAIIYKPFEIYSRGVRIGKKEQSCIFFFQIQLIKRSIICH